MVQHKTEGKDAIYHMAASGIAAVINFPLWRASAIAQSGFKIEGSNFMVRYYKAVMKPPYRGVLATMGGMTWARAAIFFGSDLGKDYMKYLGYSGPIAQTVPPFVIGTLVQIINMPLVRATITIQDPNSKLRNVTEALVYIYRSKGISGLWHGVSAGIMKTVPKYVTAVAVKDIMEERLPQVDHSDKNGMMIKSGIKSVTAGLAGAILTNPLDVLRNEMFKTDLGLTASFKKLIKEEGWAFCWRGMTSNMTAVAVPIAITIFATDMLLSFQNQ